MITSAICLFAEQVIRDSESNKISAINILDGIKSDAFPVFIPSLVFYAVFKKEPAEPQIVDVMFILTGNGREILRQPHRIDFQNELLCRAIIRVIGFIIVAPGTTKGEMKSADDKIICSCEFSAASTQPVLSESLFAPAVAKQPEAHRFTGQEVT